MNKYLLEILEDNECLVATGFDEAIIGFSYGLETRAVYDIDQVLDILQREDGMTREDAMEHFDYNIAGSYVGPKTPIFVYCTDPAFTIEGSDE
jgi:hypothetical protein